MEGMQGFPDKYFDLAVVDPPYGIGEDGAKSHSRKGLAKATKYKAKDWDTTPPSQHYFDEVRRVSKNQIVWGYNYFADMLPAARSIIIWDKKCHDKYSTDMSDAELAWYSLGGRVSVFRYLWSGMMQGSANNGVSFVGDLSLKENRIHPTQKPIALYNWLLKNYATPGQRILDTHLGSQSSRIAAYKLGFDFWGYELDADYFKEGCARYDKAISEPLFDVRPTFTQATIL